MPPVTGSRSEQGSQDGETSNSEAKEQAQVLDEAKVDPPRIKVEDGAPGEERECGWLPSKDRGDDVEGGAPGEEQEGGWLPSKDKRDDVENSAPGEEREGGWLPSKDRSDDQEQSNTENLYWIDQQGRSPRSP